MLLYCASEKALGWYTDGPRFESDLVRLLFTFCGQATATLTSSTFRGLIPVNVSADCTLKHPLSGDLILVTVKTDLGI